MRGWEATACPQSKNPQGKKKKNTPSPRDPKRGAPHAAPCSAPTAGPFSAEVKHRFLGRWQPGRLQGCAPLPQAGGNHPQTHAPLRPGAQTEGRAQLLTRQPVFHKPVKSLTEFCPVKPLAPAPLLTRFKLGIWNRQRHGTGRSELARAAYAPRDRPGSSCPKRLKTHCYEHVCVSPLSWAGAPRSKAPLPSDGSSSGATLTCGRRKRQQKSPSARASAYQTATLMGGAWSGRCSSRFLSETLLLHQGNTQKNILLCVSSGVG